MLFGKKKQKLDDLNCWNTNDAGMWKNFMNFGICEQIK